MCVLLRWGAGASYVLDGQTCYMATTQFEPAGARQALPCWDEPAHKAIFSVSLVVPKGMQGAPAGH